VSICPLSGVNTPGSELIQSESVHSLVQIGFSNRSNQFTCGGWWKPLSLAGAGGLVLGSWFLVLRREPRTRGTRDFHPHLGMGGTEFLVEGCPILGVARCENIAAGHDVHPRGRVLQAHRRSEHRQRAALALAYPRGVSAQSHVQRPNCTFGTGWFGPDQLVSIQDWKSCPDAPQREKIARAPKCTVGPISVGPVCIREVP